VLVFVEDAAEAVMSVDAQMGQPVWISDRFGQWCEWSGIREALVRSMVVVEVFEFVQCVQQVSLGNSAGVMRHELIAAKTVAAIHPID
jgi:hypothetical protein